MIKTKVHSSKYAAASPVPMFGISRRQPSSTVPKFPKISHAKKCYPIPKACPLRGGCQAPLLTWGAGGLLHTTDPTRCP